MNEHYSIHRHLFVLEQTLYCKLITIYLQIELNNIVTLFFFVNFEANNSTDHFSIKCEIENKDTIAICGTCSYIQV